MKRQHVDVVPKNIGPKFQRHWSQRLAPKSLSLDKYGRAAAALGVSASGNDFQEGGSACDGEPGRGDNRAIMPGLCRPRRLELKRILCRATKINAIELPLVGEWLIGHCRDMKAGPGRCRPTL